MDISLFWSGSIGMTPASRCRILVSMTAHYAAEFNASGRSIWQNGLVNSI